MDHFEYTNHDIHQNVLSHYIYKPFLCGYNLHQSYHSCLGGYQNLLSQAIMFHQIFSNGPYIHTGKRFAQQHKHIDYHGLKVCMYLQISSSSFHQTFLCIQDSCI